LQLSEKPGNWQGQKEAWQEEYHPIPWSSWIQMKCWRIENYQVHAMDWEVVIKKQKPNMLIILEFCM
jgi:hypothetical protein